MSFAPAIRLVLLIVAIITLGPLATIWSLNTLFGMGIEYTIWFRIVFTWLATVATVWLSIVTLGIVSGAIRRKKD